MTVEDIAAAPGFDAEAAGNGDEVFWLDASSSSAAITHEGTGHFSVEVFDKSGATTVIDTSGAVDKTLPFSAPAYVQVRSEGSWVITLKSQTDAGSS